MTWPRSPSPVTGSSRIRPGPGFPCSIWRRRRGAAGDLDTARRAATESLELSREHGYRIGALHAHLLLAALAGDAGDSGLLTAHAREGADIARQLDDPHGMAAAVALLDQAGH